MANNTQDTPMMKQFRDIKAQYPDAMLLFRCGDFYETYCEDAVRASKILNITLTHRSNGTTSAPIDMAGFPFHALDTYLPKLVRAGLRVAICDQLEDPKLAKKLVKRGVTELVTPGVSYSDTTLQQKENNFVACVHFGKTAIGISFLDISTGEFLVAQGDADYIDKLLVNFAPKEVLYLRGKKDLFESHFGNRYFTFELDDWMMTPDAANDRLTKQFQTSNLKGFGIDSLPQGVIAAGAILHYLDMTQHLQTGHIQHLSRIEVDRYVWLDRFTIRNLELLGGQTAESRTLIDILDRTQTPMGGRLLRRWLAFPLKNVRSIRNRQSVVEYLFRYPEVREQLSEQLATIQDLERQVGKVATGRIGPRELRQLGNALQAMEQIKALCETAKENEFLHVLGNQIDLCAASRDRILHELALDPPAVQGRPDTIAAGIDADLDELRGTGDFRDMSDILDKTKALLGDEKISTIASKRLLIVGVGGVGGTALEALARSGFKKFVLIDCDVVDISNLNRQILFTQNDIGKLKTDVAKSRLININSEIEALTINSRIGVEKLDDLHLGGIDFIVDAIDSVEGKLHIYEYALRNNIPFISSLGMGNRLDPEKVTLTTLNKTENDPLAKKIRYESRKMGFDIKNIPVVFSSEAPLIKSPKPNSMIMVPSTAGLLIAKYILNTIL